MSNPIPHFEAERRIRDLEAALAKAEESRDKFFEQMGKDRSRAIAAEAALAEAREALKPIAKDPTDV